MPEPLGGAHSDLAKAYKLVDEALERNLQQVLGSPVDELLEARYKKFRNLGQFG